MLGNKYMVGYKQTLKAIENGSAKMVLLAEDCEDRIRLSVEAAANSAGVTVMSVKTMRELGEMCSINVGASCAVAVND